MKKWIILILIVIALGAATAYRVNKMRTAKPVESIDKAQEREGKPVRVFPAEVRDLQESISVSGTISPYRQIKITSTITERIEEIHVSTGQRVSKEELLVTLDDTESKIDLASAGASLSEAEHYLRRLRAGSRPEEIQTAQAYMEQSRSEYERQEIELERQRQLYQEQATTLQRVQDVETLFNNAKASLAATEAQYELTKKGPRQEDIQIAEARVALAKAALERAEEYLSDHYLKAQFAGVVSLKLLEAGDIAEMNKIIFQLVDVSKVYLDLDVSEIHIPKIAAGMTVRIAVDALGDEAITGTIAEINPIANISDRSYLTRILIDNTAGKLRPGMFARAFIAACEISQGLVIPADAVRNEEKESFVLVVDGNNTVQRKDVTVGKNFSNMVEVQKGLIAGEKVITLSQNVMPGDKVKLSE